MRTNGLWPAHIGNFELFVMGCVSSRSGNWSKNSPVRNLTDGWQNHSSIPEEGLACRIYCPVDRSFQEDCKALNLLPPHWTLRSRAYTGADRIDSASDWRGKGLSGEGRFRLFQNWILWGLRTAFGWRTGRSHLGYKQGNLRQADRDSAADFALWKAEDQRMGRITGPLRGRDRVGILSAVRFAWSIWRSWSSFWRVVGFPHHENEIAQVEAVTCRPLPVIGFICHLMVEDKDE